MELLERSDELARLQAALESARSGAGRLVLIRGEAGIGKTSLVSAFLSGRTQDAHVLTGACDDLLTRRPLGPLWEMATDEPSLAGVLDGSERHLIHQAVVELLSRTLRPTVMAIEDAHWADDATLDLIRYVGRRVDRTHGMLVVTYRDEEIATDHPLRMVLGDMPPHAIERIVLRPLSESAVRTLAAGAGIDTEIFAETSGNPFFVSELLTNEEDAVPLSVVDAVRARAARLSVPALRLVHVVSVVPGRAAVELIAQLLPDWVDALDEAERRGVLLRAANHVMFRHEVARRAVQESLTAGRRADLNQQILRLLLAGGGDRARIVHHAVEAGDVEVLLEQAPMAADEAAAISSHQEAYGHYLALQPIYHRLPAPERAELLYRWSSAALLVGTVAEAELRVDEAIALWDALGDRAGLGKALRWRSRVSWLQGDRGRAQSNADEAVRLLEELGPSAELAFAYSSQAQLAMLAWDFDLGIRQSERAEAAARETNAPRILAHAMVNRGTCRILTRYPDGGDVLTDAIELAAGCGAHDEVTRGNINLTWGALLARDVTAAEELARHTIAICEQFDQVSFEGYARVTLALIRLMQGAWLECDDLARPLTGDAGHWATVGVVALTALGRLEVRRGEQRASSTLERAWEMATRMAEPQRSTLVAAAIAEQAWMTGDTGLAAEIVGPQVAAAVTGGAHWMAAEIAYWARKAGVDAPPVPDLPEPYRLIAGGDWAGAAEAWSQLGMPYEQAMSLADGDDRAQIEALRVFDGLGAKPVAARLRSEMRERGVGGIPSAPTEATRSHPVGLTPRQAEVIELLAEGLSNPEIADRLFVSARTVDHHVSAILTKLDVSTRREAVAAARRVGVLPAAG